MYFSTREYLALFLLITVMIFIYAGLYYLKTLINITHNRTMNYIYHSLKKISHDIPHPNTEVKKTVTNTIVPKKGWAYDPSKDMMRRLDGEHFDFFNEI